MRAALFGVDLTALALTLAIGAIGGAVAAMAHLPLGYLLGSLVAVAGFAMLGLRPFGRVITLPARLRMGFVPVIGVSIGGAFTPEVAGQALGWGPSLIAMCLFVPIAHAIGYGIYRRGGLDRREAFFGAVPGGLIESVQLGEEAGADVRLLTVLQFLRLIGTIIAVPMLFWGLTGHAVGSAAGAKLAAGAIGAGDAVVLALAGGVGVAVARVLRFPGWIITGPLVASAVLHGAGLVQGALPGWMLAATQVILGTGLGARFVGIEAKMLKRAAWLALINGIAALLLALSFAWALHLLVDEPVAAVFLAFAPGGLAEMSLIALSLKMSVIYVTAHHVLRIVLAVTFAKLGAKRLG